MPEDIKDISTRGALVAIAIASLLIAVLVGISVFRGVGNQAVSKAPDKKKYQAVFLTNGQVYFGHLANVGTAYVTLNDVYYIQQQQQDAKKANDQNNLSLVKLGQEIHGPERNMNIASSQIIFWENLKDDGKVVDAIKKGVTNTSTGTDQGGSATSQGTNQGTSNQNTGNQSTTPPSQSKTAAPSSPSSNQGGNNNP